MHPLDAQQIITSKSNAARISVWSNAILVALKLAVGVLISSVSVISEAIHSAIDLLAAIIALFAVKIGGQPADDDHPFGHGKVENLSAAVEAVLILVAAIWIISEAIHKLLKPQAIEDVGWGFGIMVISAVANFFVSRNLFKVARQTDSAALEADAWHLRTDVYTSVGVVVALGLLWLAEVFLPGRNFYWLDPVAAIIVALLILKAAWDLTIQAAHDLIDTSLPAIEELWIREYIGRLDPSVRGFHGLRTRKAGAVRFIEFHLQVKHTMSVEKSHKICDTITADLEKHFPGSSITVHVEPCNGRCTEKCIAGCFLSAADRETLRNGGKL
jgi:cation diffusion facilitator family transporter